MVHISELRIGNYITTYISDEIVQVVGLRTQQVKDGDYKTISVAADRHLLEDHVLGVPLSEDILLRCGAKKEEYRHDLTYYLWADMWQIEFVFKDNSLSSVTIKADGGYDECGEKDITERCKFLHQLQNTFWGLEGTELVVALQK